MNQKYFPHSFYSATLHSQQVSKLGLGYYAFQIAYYAFERRSKFFPIMPQLCSTVPYYVP